MVKHRIWWKNCIKMSMLVQFTYLICISGQQIRSKIDSYQMLTFLFCNQTLWCYHSLESSRRDDFNEGHIIGFGWELRKLLWKPFCSLFLNCSPVIWTIFPVSENPSISSNLMCVSPACLVLYFACLISLFVVCLHLC